MNYFKLFGLEETVDIDLDHLEEVYLQMQSEDHPDKFIGSKDQELAIEKSILINTAYTALKTYLTRAHHLLEISGIKSEGFEDPCALEEIFSDREDLSNAKSENDLLALYKKSVLALEKLKNEFSHSFSLKDFESAAIAYQKMLYKNKFINQIKKKCK